MTDTELELAQLLCTRLCHDLAGPVGAVAAGVELIGGDPAQADAETLDLIGNSSAAAILKLKFMRAALGAAGAAAGDPRALLEGYLEAVAGPAGKPTVNWPAPEALAAGAGALGTAWIQVLLNLCLLALEIQPGCRSLTVKVRSGAQLVVSIEARANAERAVAAREDLIAAVTGKLAVLSAKTVHSNVAGRLIRAAGGAISVTAAPDGVALTTTFPASAVLNSSAAP